MSTRSRLQIFTVASIFVLAVLVRQTLITPIELDQVMPAVFFGLLMVFATIFGVALGSGIASLLPMITIAAFLALGKLPVAWMAFLGAILHGIIRHYYADRLRMPRPAGGFDLLAVTAANATMHTTTVLVSGTVYERVGGVVPLTVVDSTLLVPLLILGLTYFAANNFIAGIYLRMRGRTHYHLHLRELLTLLLYEATPMIVAPLVALIYTRLGQAQLAVFALVAVLLSLITHSLDQTRQRLERRVRELDSLQLVGQALSASLNLDAVTAAVYAQVERLMPVDTFYVASWDAETEEINFTLVMEKGRPVQWPARRAGNGLTEHVLRTRESLLIRKDLDVAVESLALEPVILNTRGSLAASWLGVPMLAGDELLGIIAVQAHSTPEVYDQMHRDVLMTIGAQAAIAIQNARLYASTDSALAQRIQELDLILRTTHDGILLLDREWQVLSANRAFAELAGLTNAELKGRSGTNRPEEDSTLIASFGYTWSELKEDCRQITKGAKSLKSQITMPGAPERRIERTLVPVRVAHDRDQAVAGWLIVCRDITEEYELSRLREDMTHMLVHDLRSPLSVILGSLDTSRASLDEGRGEDIDRTLQLAQTSGTRMLDLINDLLDVYRLESGGVPLYSETVPVALLLAEAKDQFMPLLADTGITVDLEMDQDLPPLLVDLDYVSRALQNLLDNAIKYTPDRGRIRLWARLDNEFASPTMLVGVSDLGPGISPENQGRLFQKFASDITIGGRRQGTGLGLPYCKLVVEAHGGEIWVVSSGEHGKGSTFVMRLPVDQNSGSL
jgi:signal transduction histidine kinase